MREYASTSVFCLTAKAYFAPVLMIKTVNPKKLLFTVILEQLRVLLGMMNSG